MTLMSTLSEADRILRKIPVSKSEETPFMDPHFTRSVSNKYVNYKSLYESDKQTLLKR